MIKNVGTRKLSSLFNHFLMRIRADLLLAIALGVWLLCAIAYVVPAINELNIDFGLTFSEMALLTFVIALFAQAATNSPSPPVRNFWLLFAFGFSFWTAARLSTMFTFANSSWNPDLVRDLLYLGHYTCIIIAVELRLETRNNPLWSLNYMTSAATGVLLLISVYCYFALLPYISGTLLYQSQDYVYAACDAYLTLRFVAAALQSREPSWSRVYAVFAVTFGLITAADILQWLYREEYLDYRRESALNVVWTLWSPAAYLASRVRLRISEGTAPLIQRIYPAANILLLFGLALPVVHLAGYGFGVLGTESLNIRTVFVFFWILLVGAILFAFQWLMRKRIFALTIESDASRTKAQSLEQQLERTLVMGTLGRLSAGLAHDFGNTISAINMHASLMANKTNTGEIDRRDIEGVSVGVRYAQEMLDKLREFGSTGRSLNAGPFDIVPEIRNTLQLVRPSLDPQIQLQFGGSAARALAIADKADVHRILTNYLYNAIDAVGVEGVIVVDVHVADVNDQCASCAAWFSGRFVEMRVCDNGKGVDPALADGLFEPLITSKSAGTGGGLGLATVHGIVHRLGGHVGLRASTPRGSCFSAYFVAAS